MFQFFTLKNDHITIRWYLTALTLLLITISVSYIWPIYFPGNPPSIQELNQQVFSRLHKVRIEKKEDIFQLLSEFQQKAFAINDDKEMHTYFKTILRNQVMPDTEYKIDKKYVESYGDFYDILFVDTQGVVRHSIKRESDYKKNLLSPPFTNSELSKILEHSFAGNFAEFEYYPPSAEPAAFFSVPFKEMNKTVGWFVLQLAANTMNAVLTERKGLGQTGEVYLVNNRKLMLTDSRFYQRSTILRKTIVTEAVDRAFKDGTGERVINDYRGTAVYSSFEKLEIFDTEWVLIVEIDEDEILTDVYRKYKKHYSRDLLSFINVNFKETNTSDAFNSGVYLTVEMNEYKRDDAIHKLKTYGVATCTAVTATHPGKFGYLAHLAPTDEIFMRSWYIQAFLGGNSVNLLRELFGQIFYFDLYPSERQQLNVVIIVPHEESVIKTIDALLGQGLRLNNLKIMYDKKALSANILFDTVSNIVSVEWNRNNGVAFSTSNDSHDLATALKYIISKGA